MQCISVNKLDLNYSPSVEINTSMNCIVGILTRRSKRLIQSRITMTFWSRYVPYVQVSVLKNV